MVGLQTGRQGTGEPDGCVAVGGDANLAGPVNQVQVRHELRHARHDLGCQTAAGTLDLLTRDLVGQDPFPELGKGPVLDLRINLFVDVVLDDLRNLVVLVGDDRVVSQVRNREVGQDMFGRNAFLHRGGNDSRESVTGFFLVCLRKDLLDVLELVDVSEELGLEVHRYFTSRGMLVRIPTIRTKEPRGRAFIPIASTLPSGALLSQGTKKEAPTGRHNATLG